MKLQQVETWVAVPPTGIGGAFWVIVRLTTDNGIQGIGECYGIPVSGDIACHMVEDTFERYIDPLVSRVAADTSGRTRIHRRVGGRSVSIIRDTQRGLLVYSVHSK